MARIRDPAVAGMFYPKNKKDLLELIKSLEKHVKEKHIDKKIKGLIVPHAGYIYSGIVASTAYKALSYQYKNIHATLIGPSHYFAFYDLVKSTYEYWRTPLGLVKVNNLLEFPDFDTAFAHEHSLEVQLPFMQYYFKNTEIFPLLASKVINYENIVKELESIAHETLFIISSDLSHYYPYDLAVEKDTKTINAILELDVEKFKKEGEACGKEGIILLMKLAKIKKWKPLLLHYMNSGDVSNNKSNVVGYTSIAFVEY